jgi:hypothetical protein
VNSRRSSRWIFILGWLALILTLFLGVLLVVNQKFLSHKKSFFLTLKLNETKSLPNKITLSLKKLILPLPQQKDGLTRVEIEIGGNQNKEELIYNIGGFAGYEINELKFKQGKIRLIAIYPDKITLEVILK